MKNLLVILLLTICAGFRVQAQSPGELPVQRAGELLDAINARNTEKLLPLLADTCRVQQFDGGMAHKVLQAIVLQLPEVDTICVTGIRLSEHLTLVEAEMRWGGKTRPCSFSLDAQGRFTQIVLVKEVQVAQKRLEPLSLAPYSQLRFENRKGFIVLREGTGVDGHAGVFVLDSGAKSTLLNSASHVGAGAVVASGAMSRKGVVSSGVRATQLVRVDSLLIGNSVFSLQGPALDLSELAANIGVEELTGLIGADLLRHFETHIDYRKGVVCFYRPDSDGTAAGTPKPLKRIGFELLNGYLPVFDIEAGGHSLRMVFDTGAQRCSLTPRSVEKLGQAFRNGDHVQLRDADSAARVLSGKIGSIEWGGVKKRNVGCVVRDLAAIGDIDGILGYPMVASKHVSLNFARREFCIY